MYVEVHVMIKAMAESGTDFYGVTLFKNGSHISLACESPDEENETVKTINLHDIVRCAPGDTLKLALWSDGSTVFFQGSTVDSGGPWAPGPGIDGFSFVTFKILGFEKNPSATSCAQTPPPEIT